jgi:hypothetical protein
MKPRARVLRRQARLLDRDRGDARALAVKSRMPEVSTGRLEGWKVPDLNDPDLTFPPSNLPVIPPLRTS